MDTSRRESASSRIVLVLQLPAHSQLFKRKMNAACPFSIFFSSLQELSDATNGIRLWILMNGRIPQRFQLAEEPLCRSGHSKCSARLRTQVAGEERRGTARIGLLLLNGSTNGSKMLAKCVAGIRRASGQVIVKSKLITKLLAGRYLLGLSPLTLPNASGR